MYFDLCDLKVYNRRYGLKAGDQQICSLGKLIKEYFQEDKSARFESDHFVAYAGDDQIESRLMDLFSQMKDLNGETTWQSRSGSLNSKTTAPGSLMPATEPDWPVNPFQRQTPLSLNGLMTR